MSGPELVVEVVDREHDVTVLLHGELDAHGEPSADLALETAAGRTSAVVLDLRGLAFIDSTGMRLVLQWSRRLGERGIAFTVVRGAEHVQRPFTSAGLDGLLPFVDGPPG